MENHTYAKMIRPKKLRRTDSGGGTKISDTGASREAPCDYG